MLTTFTKNWWIHQLKLHHFSHLCHLFCYSGCPPDSWCGFSQIRMSISGSKAPVPWSNVGDDDWTSVCFNHLMDSGGVYNFYYFLRFSTKSDSKKIQEVSLISPCSHFQHLAANSPKTSINIELVAWQKKPRNRPLFQNLSWFEGVFAHKQRSTCSGCHTTLVSSTAAPVMEEQRLWKIADIDGDLNVALGPAKAKFFISIRMWHQTEDDGIGVGCNTCKDGCLLAMSFMSNLYCCAFTGYTHTQLSDTNCI